MQIGDRVKLRDDIGQRLNKGLHYVDWPSRRGTVTRTSPRGEGVAVRWDGRKTVEIWPAPMLTLVESPAYSSPAS
jgi:hypothetical protein